MNGPRRKLRTRGCTISYGSFRCYESGFVTFFFLRPGRSGRSMIELPFHELVTDRSFLSTLKRTSTEELRGPSDVETQWVPVSTGEEESKKEGISWEPEMT